MNSVVLTAGVCLTSLWSPTCTQIIHTFTAWYRRFIDRLHPDHRVTSADCSHDTWLELWVSCGCRCRSSWTWETTPSLAWCSEQQHRAVSRLEQDQVFTGLLPTHFHQHGTDSVTFELFGKIYTKKKLVLKHQEKLVPFTTEALCILNAGQRRWTNQNWRKSNENLLEFWMKSNICINRKKLVCDLPPVSV